MKRALTALLFVLAGCIPTTSSTITVSGVAEPPAAIARIDGIVKGLGFYPVQPAQSAEKPGTIVKVYHSALSSGIFVVARSEPPGSSIDFYFAERAESFSPLAVQKRDELV